MGKKAKKHTVQRNIFTLLKTGNWQNDLTFRHLKKNFAERLGVWGGCGGAQKRMPD
jgi:hypothetical protein